MNTWFRRAVGTVGVAGGMLLLGAGAAHAHDAALAPGQLDDLLSPIGGPANQALSLNSDGLPGFSNGLPVRGNLKPVNDATIPLGGWQRAATEDLPLAGGVPGGSDVLKDNTMTGLPVVGSIGPTPGFNTVDTARGVVPTTGALPYATGGAVPDNAFGSDGSDGSDGSFGSDGSDGSFGEQAYAPKHSDGYRPKHSTTEALPVIGGLPLMSGVAGGGGLAGGGLPRVGGLPV